MLELIGMPDYGYIIIGLIGIVITVLIDRKIYGRKW